MITKAGLTEDSVADGKNKKTATVEGIYQLGNRRRLCGCGRLCQVERPVK